MFVKKKGKMHLNSTIETLNTQSSLSVSDPSDLSSNIILQLNAQATTEDVDNVLERQDFSLIDLHYKPSIHTPDPYDNITLSRNIYAFTDEEKKQLETSEHIDKGDKDVEGQGNENTIRDFSGEERCVEDDNLQKTNEEESQMCWWCRHSMKTKYQLPLRYVEEHYECVGQFCSIECTSAYCIESGVKYGDMWEQLEFIHGMYDVKTRIYPAPHWEQLSIFGGKMSIEEFRKKRMDVTLQHPPMVSLKLYMDDMPITSKLSKLNSLNIESATTNLKQTSGDSNIHHSKSAILEISTLNSQTSQFGNVGNIGTIGTIGTIGNIGNETPSKVNISNLTKLAQENLKEKKQNTHKGKNIRTKKTPTLDQFITVQ